MQPIEADMHLPRSTPVADAINFPKKRVAFRRSRLSEVFFPFERNVSRSGADQSSRISGLSRRLFLSAYIPAAAIHGSDIFKYILKLWPLQARGS
jgi:hypothetical protein